MSDQTISAGGIDVAGEQPVDDAPHVRGLRVASPGGVATTVHVASFPLAERLILLDARSGLNLDGARPTPAAIAFRER